MWKTSAKAYAEMANNELTTDTQIEDTGVQAEDPTIANDDKQS